MRNNSQFAVDQGHNYVVVDFENVTEKGLKKLITALKNAGSPVSNIEAPNKKQKRDGETIKRAKFFFENGQTMTLFIGDHGDIFQMTLNATKQPIPSVKSERELAKEMTRLMERNQAKFNKAQERKAAKVVIDTSDTKPASRSLSKRIEEANAAVQAAQANFDASTHGIQSLRQQTQDKQSRVAELESTLAAEKQETKELEAQIEALEAN